ncbi:MAG: polysaccharide biosynthesis C-terminal domain-containing protein [Bacteroidetes bacterium]|nr:polysaccharide biosynthesis C-terminal domain-containing protein [Bacteroidota bacterium]MDA1224073.1 polysaccharide biosynthesis C-terminal domain-containing protein [Bacteroidota bacterium]
MVCLAHALGASAFGELSWVEGLCRLLGLLFSIGIPIYGPKALMQCGTDGERKAVFNGLLRIHLAIVLLMILVVVCCFQGLKWDGFLPWPWIYLLSQVFQLEWYFQGTQRFDFVIKRSLWVRSLALLLVFVLVKKPQDVYMGFMIMATTQWVLGALNVWHLRKEIDFTFNLGIHKNITWIKPVIWICISSLCITGYTLIDTVILGSYSNSLDVGNYTVAVRIAKLPMVLMGAFVSMIVLKLTSIKNTGSVTDFENLLEKSFKSLMLVILPIAILLASLPEVWIDLVGGSTFSSAAGILRIVAWILPLMVFSNVFGFQVLIALNKERHYMYVSMGGLIVSLISFFIFIPLWGSTGAALGILVTEFTVACLAIICARNLIKVQKLLRFAIYWTLFLIPIYFLLAYAGSVIDNKIILCVLSSITMVVYGLFITYFVLKERWCFHWISSTWFQAISS